MVYAVFCDSFQHKNYKACFHSNSLKVLRWEASSFGMAARTAAAHCSTSQKSVLMLWNISKICPIIMQIMVSSQENWICAVFTPCTSFLLGCFCFLPSKVKQPRIWAVNCMLSCDCHPNKACGNMLWWEGGDPNAFLNIKWYWHESVHLPMDSWAVWTPTFWM